MPCNAMQKYVILAYTTDLIFFCSLESFQKHPFTMDRYGNACKKMVQYGFLFALI